MREILFRGKRLDNGEFVFGMLTKHYFGLGFSDAICTFMGNKLKHYEIDPETIGQYIGISDINGNKIFEGDILKESEYGIFKVVYEVDYAKFRLQFTKESSIQYPSWNRGVEMEIIGNIHD